MQFSVNSSRGEWCTGAKWNEIRMRTLVKWM